MNLVIFIIIYLIVCLLLSILISFLFLRQYACKDKSKVKELKCNYFFSYYFNIVFFSLTIFHIFITALDHSLSAFENYPFFQNNFIEKILSILPKYYFLIELISYGLTVTSRLYYYINTSGYFYKCDIACDAITRCLYLEKNSERIIKNNYQPIIIFVFLFILIIIYGVLIKGFITINSVIDFVKLIINFNTFYKYFILLFYIGFIVQNLFDLNTIECDYNQKQNYNIWKLGKIYSYYDKERNDLKKSIDKIKDKYEKSFSGFDYKSLDNEDQRFIAIFENKYNLFTENIQKLDKDYEIINLKFENIEEAIIKFRQAIYDEFIEENERKNNSEKLYHISDRNEYDMMKKYADIIIQKKDSCDSKCGCDCDCVHCCFCCCGNKKRKYYKQRIVEEICYMMSKINEKLISFKRKCFLINSIIQKLKKNYSKKNKCCSKYCCYFIIIIFILIIFENPFYYLDFDDNNSEDIVEKEFLFTLGLYIFLIIFYFFIFIYGIIVNREIYGETLFGKNKSMSDGINFFKFSYTLGFFSPVIYHAGWVLNKKGKINAQFNEVFVLPDYEIDKNLNLMSIFPYISLGLIFLFIFISSKFSKLSICNFIIFDFNENSGFFDDNEKFYGYFFIGCGCYIDIFKRNQYASPLLLEDENTKLIN